jgi:PKD repeat protein
MNNIMIKEGDIWMPYKYENVNVDFMCSNRESNVNEMINFIDLTYPIPSYWIWKFGDGVESELRNPSHSYQQEGLYTITLMVSYDSGSKFIVKNNYIQISNQFSTTTIEPGPTQSYGETQSTPD